MRDRDNELEYIRAAAAIDRVSVKVNGITHRSVPATENLVDEFVRRTGDGEIRDVVITDADREAREEDTDGVAYGVWKILYGNGSDYANSLRAQAVAKRIAAFHLTWMADQADEV